MDTDRLTALMREHSVSVTCNACTCQTNHLGARSLPARGIALSRHGGGYLLAAGSKTPGKNSFEAEIEKFNQAYLERDLAGILCMGMDPGAVNVFARWAMDRLDSASSIRVLDADNAEVRGYRFAVLFSPETCFEELGAVPYYVKDARVVSGKPLETEIEWVRFPDPIGLQKPTPSRTRRA